ncbi:DTW domain-containing protein [Chloropicon primus]|uniref:tRNA-uridine aminocarboxypropyltransferase n=2 Tax=Chloropicon primus TaxID=1764295 RepID=A0A5B8MDN4_9CHLO|nr:DTW domain-containing protein [Chloropicon primus]UPQ97485.1 DTW domain-containing protein [Chloropicon primus]|eukprot:QDZ18274.1 DTW domain-containing protein [Chloropicon primus]
MEEPGFFFGALSLSSDEEEGGAGGCGTTGRRICEGCDRPKKNACLCSTFPAGGPIELRGGKVIVLQHPNEKKRKLATVAILKKVLGSCDVLVGRQFTAERYPVLAETLRLARDGSVDVFVLYPGAKAESLEDLAEERRASAEGDGRRWVLIAIDGTWQQAKEMFTFCRDLLLPRGVENARRVELNRRGGGGGEGEGLLLMTEPDQGCVTTMEAIATAVSIMEGGEAMEEALLAPLAKLVSLQKGFNPAVKARLGVGGSKHTKTRRSRLKD